MYNVTKMQEKSDIKSSSASPLVPREMFSVRFLLSRLKIQYLRRVCTHSSARRTSGRRRVSGAYETTARGEEHERARWRDRAECAECNGATDDHGPLSVPEYLRRPSSRFFRDGERAVARHSASFRAEGEVRHVDRRARSEMM